MVQQSKQSEVSVIYSNHKVFFWARLKLTGIYVLIVTVIVVGFSIFLYQNLQSSLNDAADGDFINAGSQQHFVDYTLTSFENDIFVVDIIILLVTAILGYMLASYTLLPIQRSMEAQRVFSENASHELRTPLAVMKNDMEVLLRNPSPSIKRIHKTLFSNIEEIDRLSRMVANLLALARSQKQKVHTSSDEKINITIIAQKVSGKMNAFAIDKGVSLVVRGEPSLITRISVTVFERVVINLLQNAIDHTHRGGVVTVETHKDGQKGILIISDTGSGISKKDLPHIFERFYKGEGTSGSGLGLYIVKTLINQYGGNISINSTQGTETIAKVTLPLV